MLIKVSRTTLLGITFGWLLGACQAAEDSASHAHSHSHSHSHESSSSISGPSAREKAGTEEHSSEAIVGPDEAFFAAQFLEQFFRYSKDNSKPELNPNLSLAGSEERVSAFAFEANFSDSRLQIMAQALLNLGDKDGDGSLSEAEFLGMRLRPEIFGVAGDPLAHSYSRELYQQTAGEGAALGIEEIKNLLRSVGPSLKAYANQKGDKEQRLLLIRAWDKVLKSFDRDQDGSISSTEQKALRQERSGILARLQG